MSPCVPCFCASVSTSSCLPFPMSPYPLASVYLCPCCPMSPCLNVSVSQDSRQKTEGSMEKETPVSVCLNTVVVPVSLCHCVSVSSCFRVPVSSSLSTRDRRNRAPMVMERQAPVCSNATVVSVSSCPRVGVSVPLGPCPCVFTSQYSRRARQGSMVTETPAPLRPDAMGVSSVQVSNSAL